MSRNGRRDPVFAIVLVVVASGVVGLASARGELPASCHQAGRAYLTVDVPDTAMVVVNGYATKSTGGRRRYVSCRLKPGHSYKYRVRVAVRRGGSVEERTKVVLLRARDRAELRFDFSKAEVRQPAPARPRSSAPLRTELRVAVPADARVHVEGHEIPGTGPLRSFSTTRLAPGSEPAEYKVRVTIDRLGRTLAKEQEIVLRAGENHELAFDFSDLQRQTLATRDEKTRQEVVRQAGGSQQTEGAVAAALRWLARQQRPDGSWTLHSPEYRGTRNGKPTRFSDIAATSLALLPFLGAGQTHQTGGYRREVADGLDWLIGQQRADGDLRGDVSLDKPLYAHGIAAIVLCEALAMTDDDVLRRPAQKAIDFTVAAQHSGGGWRYLPGEPGDTSVLGWHMMALHSAGIAGLNVPPSAMDRAGSFLDQVQSHDGARYCYQVGRAPSQVMTAQGLLCRLYLGWRDDTPQLAEGVQFLLGQHPPDANDSNMYYWYYATQLFRHVGGDQWTAWNRLMRTILVESQETTDEHAGSWIPRGGRAAEGGRLYMTALATCTLEVYYRHAPILREIGAQ